MQNSKFTSVIKRECEGDKRVAFSYCTAFKYLSQRSYGYIILQILDKVNSIFKISKSKNPACRHKKIK